MNKCNNCKYYCKGIKCTDCKKEEILHYQPKFARWIKSKKWDSIAEKINKDFISIIGMVMQAEYDGDCSWVVWKQCDYILDRIHQIAKEN